MLNPLFYIQAIALALRQIWNNKMRAFLTALGIIIGVASVTTVIAALGGLKGKILSEFESIGANKMYILHDRPDEARILLFQICRRVIWTLQQHTIFLSCLSSCMMKVRRS